MQAPHLSALDAVAVGQIARRVASVNAVV